MDVLDRLMEEEEFLYALRIETRRREAAKPSALICSCGEAIPAQRREAIPGVRFCVDCQILNDHPARPGLSSRLR